MNPKDAINPQDAINRVSTGGGITRSYNPMIHKNISTMIRWFKGRTTFEGHKILPHFAWQPRFHDHIIRNEPEFFRITEYIVYNPINWNTDCFFNPPQ